VMKLRGAQALDRHKGNYALAPYEVGSGLWREAAPREGRR